MKHKLYSKKGQTLIELTLIFPLMLALVWGVIEVGSLISAYLTLTSTTREGANLTSRGTSPDDALAAIKAAAAPLIRDNNKAQWKMIYSKIVQDPATPCAQAPCKYIVESQTPDGNFVQTSKVGVVGDEVTTTEISGIDAVSPLQTFHSIEIFYDYTPNVMTYIGMNFIDKILYDRTIFTNVSNNS
jgi:Flp pilus assembly protein TadG